jgi:hypothetical protein
MVLPVIVADALAVVPADQRLGPRATQVCIAIAFAPGGYWAYQPPSML